MKTLISALILVCLQSSISHAECNFEVAKSAGGYIAALEKAKLQRYQNNSVCEVLSYEFWNCTEQQKTALNKAVNVKEVLGNYCQPHLAVTQIEGDGNAYMKGASLYSWKDDSGYHWYALMPGTNRTKTTQELLQNKVPEGFLKMHLPNLPAGTEISWNNLVNLADPKGLSFELPPSSATREIQQKAKLAKLKLQSPGL
jgi:hypothetical protein